MNSVKTEWSLGWALVLASFAGFLFHSMPVSSLSAYIGPLEDEFGWSRTVISAGVTVGSIISALLMPVVGAFVDRFGSRRVVLPGIILSGMSWAVFSAMTGAEWQWLALFFIHGVFNVMIGAVLWTTAVAGTFKSNQGMAIGVTLAGATAAHTVAPPLTVFLIAEFGWRMAFIMTGTGLGVIAFILCFKFFYDHRDRQRIAPQSAGKMDDANLTGLSLRQAASNTALWRIGISILIIIALTIGFLIHQIEILSTVGVTRTNAAWLASFAGLMGIVGKLVTGVLLDRYHCRWVGGVTMAAAAISFAMLISNEISLPLLIFVMMVNGYTAGAKLQVASYLTVRYAGMRNFGKIYGFISSLVAFGAAAGPLIAGSIYDLTGGYEMFLMAGAVGLLISALLLFTLPRYPDWSRQEPLLPQDSSPAAA